MPNCNVSDCTRKYYAVGWCEMHYRRVKKYGHPEGGGTNHGPPEERFWRGVSRGSTTECWAYVRGPNRGRYGLFQVGGKGSPHVGAHRYSFELHYGPVPVGLVVMHSCDNPRCVNPAHLSAGTPKQNTADMIAKGRRSALAPVGERNGKSVITAEVARQIKASAKSNADLARHFGVSPNTVRGVRTGRTWAHVV